MRLTDVLPGLSGYINEITADFPAALTRVILFGSFAKGTARVGSDIDIALVSMESWSFENRSFVRHLFDDFDCGAKLSFFYTTESGLESDSKNDANYWIRTEGTELWSRN
jgi:hypothetical protein